ncbi:hypothetical protein GUITHDRAFT_122286 [Guillardia theta CCMP2712]|uniref:Uncharacterized protein n=1 Tax=Guillardia theta (strain CCMP2712) TaxID=905079 RepID=L1I603_GUITC|nr:hypothetical protein GUITHDRAFT_122286 [Guillardia theta CCMP2712]EKX31527.1 hypothetical protein GUITHDRAFT_122286 [Guillardia theta CCMP2712]|eukprot:XP_005818507.1 hypothetical protein GUITHDRAFT_122286 [Guillardia theta CCMP2712]
MAGRRLLHVGLLIAAIETCRGWSAPQPLRAHAGSPPRHRCLLPRVSMSTEPNSNLALDRRSLLALGISLAFLPGKLQAAIPSQEEYNVGSGTVVRAKQSNREVRKEFKAPPASKEEAVETLKDAERLVDSLSEYAKNMAWDDIRAEMLTAPLANQKFSKPDRPAILFLSFFGFKSEKELMTVMKIDKKAATRIEKLRKDASLTLMELAEFAFTNRVVFFNEEDKRTVAELSEKNLQVDLDEALRLIQDSKERIQEIIQSLSAA